jgi:hypothetical protein
MNTKMLLPRILPKGLFALVLASILFAAPRAHADPGIWVPIETSNYVISDGSEPIDRYFGSEVTLYVAQSWASGSVHIGGYDGVQFDFSLSVNTEGIDPGAYYIGTLQYTNNAQNLVTINYYIQVYDPHGPDHP